VALSKVRAVLFNHFQVDEAREFAVRAVPDEDFLQVQDHVLFVVMLFVSSHSAFSAFQVKNRTHANVVARFSAQWIMASISTIIV